MKKNSFWEAVLRIAIAALTAAQIDSWHRRQGWKLGIGYHYVIRRNGAIEPGRPEWMIGAHCHVKGQNHNAHSIGVCYEGGLDIRGHHDLNPQKDCPCFDAVAEFSSLSF